MENLLALTALDMVPFWTWFLLFARLSGVFSSLPGVGTDEVPIAFRVPLVMILAAVGVSAGLRAAEPAHMAEAGLMIGTEFALGYVLGAIPSYIIGSLAVSGQVSSMAMGLSQATMIDPSIGEHVSILSRLQAVLATVLFLSLDGHHIIIQTAMTAATDVGIGMFRPDGNVAMILTQRFIDTFALAIVVAGPVLVTLLITQFTLGIITKFVPQMNIFIISLPLTIFIGLFITGYSFSTLMHNLTAEFGRIEEIAGLILQGN